MKRPAGRVVLARRRHDGRTSATPAVGFVAIYASPDGPARRAGSVYQESVGRAVRVMPGLDRWGGVAAMLGGGAWSVRAVLVGGASVPAPGLADALLLAAPVLWLAGMAGLHARYSGRVKGLGSAGFAQSFVGLVMILGGALAELWSGTEGPQQAYSFGFLVLAFGLVLLGFEVLKAETLPRWNFLPLALGLLIPASTLAAGLAWLGVGVSVLFGLGWILLGYVLWSETPNGSGERP